MPKIEGLDHITIKVGEKFEPLSGVKAFDKEDGDITKDIKITGNVDVNKEGKYELIIVQTYDEYMEQVREKIET